MAYLLRKVIGLFIILLSLPTTSPGSSRQEVISSANKFVSLFYLLLFSGFSFIFFHSYWSIQVYYSNINVDILAFSKKIHFIISFTFSTTIYIMYYGEVYPALY